MRHTGCSPRDGTKLVPAMCPIRWSAEAVTMTVMRKAAVAGVGASTALGMHLRWVQPRMFNWGATRTEICSSMAGDDVCPRPHLNATRAVTIAARPRRTSGPGWSNGAGTGPALTVMTCWTTSAAAAPAASSPSSSTFESVTGTHGRLADARQPQCSTTWASRNRCIYTPPPGG